MKIVFSYRSRNWYIHVSVLLLSINVIAMNSLGKKLILFNLQVYYQKKKKNYITNNNKLDNIERWFGADNN